MSPARIVLILCGSAGPSNFRLAWHHKRFSDTRRTGKGPKQALMTLVRYRHSVVYRPLYPTELLIGISPAGRIVESPGRGFNALVLASSYCFSVLLSIQHEADHVQNDDLCKIWRR